MTTAHDPGDRYVVHMETGDYFDAACALIVSADDLAPDEIAAARAGDSKVFAYGRKRGVALEDYAATAQALRDAKDLLQAAAGAIDAAICGDLERPFAVRVLKRIVAFGEREQQRTFGPRRGAPDPVASRPG